MSQPRVCTEEECRERLLKTVWAYVDFWAKETRQPMVRDKLAGLAFSLLAMLDGCNAGLPGFTICPSPHPDDKEYHRERGENWWPTDEDAVDIAGSLHELFYKYEPKGSK